MKFGKKKNFIDQIEKELKEIENIIPKNNIEQIREINDYAIISGQLKIDETEKNFEPRSYNEYINCIFDKKKRTATFTEYETLKDKFHVEKIIYIPKITLINSCFGIINGINKFYEDGFIPHFEPIWKKNSDPNKGFSAYSYPYETEGIIVALNKQKICEWLLKCGKIPFIEEDLDWFFFTLKDEILDAVEILLHTLSHFLIRFSSLYSGLDTQSYGEKIFPRSGAILLFSNSSINIGGIEFIFENEIAHWFNDILLEANECTLDPNCIKNKGSCFSCLHLQEFVCCKFNHKLDRDVFLGKKRYDIGFWKF